MDRHEKKREKTTQKVMAALNKVKRSNKEITVKEIAELSGVSRRTLYDREDLLLLIKEAQSIRQDQDNPKQTKQSKLLEERITRLRDENRELKNDKMKILEQNALLTKKVTFLERRLSTLESEIYNKESLKVVPMEKK